MTGLDTGEIAELTRGRFGWQEDGGAATTRDVIALVQRCCDQWGLVVEGAFPDGVGPPVLWGTRDDGRAIVLKVGWGEEFAQQCRTLATAAGQGYAEVIAHHDGAVHGTWDALLLERLGPPLSTQGLSPEGQIDVLAATLPVAWRATAAVSVPDTRPKAEALREVLADLGRLAPDHAGLVASADARAATLTARGRHPVVVHGDPHPVNLLRRPAGDWAFVDPDGFAGDAAYDLGVTVRNWTAELITRADRDGAEGAADWWRGLCTRVTVGTGVDPELVADWGFVERVTTGLWLIRLGATEEGRHHLMTAELLR